MRRALLAVLVLAAFAAPASAHAAGVARPNPALVGLRLDYDAPLPSSTGGVARLEPLDATATAASFGDLRSLAYRQVGDLGGFLPAPLGVLALTGSARDVVGASSASQLPLLARAAGGGISSYAGAAAAGGPPDDGRQPVPGLGVPPATPTPASGGDVPPPNQGFGGRPAPPPPGGGTTGPGTTTTAPPPTAPTTTITSTTPPGTTATTTTPATTTTAPPATTTTAGTGPAPPPATVTVTTTTVGTTTTTTAPPPAPPPTYACGNGEIAIESDLPSCRFAAVNMAPGDSAIAHVTITNTSSSPYTLALKAAGTQNRLWQDLQLGVWERSTAPPSPLPPLLYWTAQFNDLATLQPGESIRLVLELYLPTSAGNDVQGLVALINFIWHASG
ncbi:MAG TPA: hypothetical protein VFL60_09865 [Gaiellaceae bacterium]|nr:hypothetical protein [Gaiellaceae bacterium]